MNILKHVFFISCLFSSCCTNAQDFFARIDPISPDIAARIVGKTWLPECPVPLKDLRYLTLAYWNFKGAVSQGEMIVHKKVAEEVVAIFKELFDAHFAIEKMHLIDEYFGTPVNSRGDIDDLSCADNNTSAFFYRMIGKTDMVSEHGLGTAIDINPRTNPFVRGTEVWPQDAHEFLNRDRDDVPGLVNERSVCYRAFAKRGWKWGGHWKNVKDYQHFCIQEIIPASFNA